MDIRPITPALVNDYMVLFDNAFSDNPHWASCYRAFYDDPRSAEDWNASRSDFPSRNRENRQNTISEGKAYGLLAYESDRPIGWVNAGPRRLYGNLHAFNQAADSKDPPVGSVMCFVIHPGASSKGGRDRVAGPSRRLFPRTRSGHRRRVSTPRSFSRPQSRLECQLLQGLSGDVPQGWIYPPQRIRRLCSSA